MARQIVFIEGTRTGYAPSQIKDMTITVGKLIEILEFIAEDIGDDALVMLNNDNGYTYGEITDWTISVEDDPDADDEEDDDDY